MNHNLLLVGWATQKVGHYRVKRTKCPNGAQNGALKKANQYYLLFSFNIDLFRGLLVILLKKFNEIQPFSCLDYSNIFENISYIGVIFNIFMIQVWPLTASNDLKWPRILKILTKYFVGESKDSKNISYGSLAAGRDFWATNVHKVQHVGTSGDFIFQANHFLSTPTFKTRVLLWWDWGKNWGGNIFRKFKNYLLFLNFFTIL